MRQGEAYQHSKAITSQRGRFTNNRGTLSTMALLGTPHATSKGPLGKFRGPLVVVMAFLLVFVVPTEGQKSCDEYDCAVINDPSHAEYRPQTSERCCKNTDNDGGDDGTYNDDKRLTELETTLKRLEVMVGVVVALVGVVLVVVVATVLVRHSSTKALKGALPVFFRNKEDRDQINVEKRPQPANKGPQENRNSTVVRIANYQNNHSPLNKRSQANGQVPHHHNPDHDHHFLTTPADPPRHRLPSESTLPDDTELPPHAYDNLALSTSTLHDTTTSSTSTLGPAVSTNTLDTTLPSVIPSTPALV